jgi:hypothetical protein
MSVAASVRTRGMIVAKHLMRRLSTKSCRQQQLHQSDQIRVSDPCRQDEIESGKANNSEPKHDHRASIHRASIR